MLDVDFRHEAAWRQEFYPRRLTSMVRAKEKYAIALANTERTFELFGETINHVIAHRTAQLGRHSADVQEPVNPNHLPNWYYYNGSLVLVFPLRKDETFADLTEAYDRLSAAFKKETVGALGKWDPDHVDQLGARTWRFIVGDAPDRIDILLKVDVPTDSEKCKFVSEGKYEFPTERFICEDGPVEPAPKSNDEIPF